MALTYDFTQVKDFKTLDRDVTNTMPFLCMIVGIGEITEKNALDFYTRVSAHERLMGSFLSIMKDGVRTDWPLTLQVIRQYIGLRCNVVNISPPQYTKRLWQAYRDQVKREAA